MHFKRGAEHSTKYGPCRRFSAVDGLAYGDDKVIAFMDQKRNEWLYYDTGYHWPTMSYQKHCTDRGRFRQRPRTPTQFAGTRVQKLR